MKRETVGKASYDLLLKNATNDHTVQEQTDEQLSHYEYNVLVCVYGEDKMHNSPFETCKEEHAPGATRHIEDATKLYGKDFFVVVESKKEPRMHNVIRNLFFHRHTCPTPQYDQCVYKYNFADDHIELIWVLPTMEAYTYLKNNFLNINDGEKELLEYVLQDCDGRLLNKCKKLNGEI